MTAATKDRELLVEQNDQALSEARVEGDVITGVVVLTSVSKNNRRYTEAALQDVAELTGGALAFADHSTKRVRPVEDLVGHLTSGRVVTDQVRANLTLVRGRFRDLMVSLAEREAPGVGLSISARGEARQDGDGIQVVESVGELRSVDLVTDAATTRSLFEAVGFEARNRRTRTRPRKPTADEREEMMREMFC